MHFNFPLSLYYCYNNNYCCSFCLCCCCYYIHHYYNMIQFLLQIFSGNTDSHSINKIKFHNPFLAKEIILSNVAVHNNFALRMELYGCQPGMKNFSSYPIIILESIILIVCDPKNLDSAQQNPFLQSNLFCQVRGFASALCIS